MIIPEFKKYYYDIMKSIPYILPVKHNRHNYRM
jgi:hypothetical protein